MLQYLLFSLQLTKQKQRLPLVLHKTPFQSWDSSNWTIDSLSSKNVEIGRILSKKSPSNTFRYFAVEQPLSNIDFMTLEKDYVEVIYTARTFFDLLRSSFDGFYYYANGGIELLNLPKPGSDESRRSLTFQSHLEAYSEPGQVNFWLGRANVTAHTHYDTSYNFHFVAQGRKRFILLPPRSYSRLKLYPCLHQLYRQASVDILAEEDLAGFLREESGMVVDLEDGDVLYIPPYWFHCVVTLNTTISLNIWSQSESFLAMEGIYQSPIPFEAHWGRVKLMKTLHYFIQLLTQQILAASEYRIGVSEFVRDRVYSRYDVVLTNKDSEIVSPILSELRPIVQDYCLAEPITQLLDEDSKTHLELGVRGIVEQFMEIQPWSVKEINLANYIEHLVWRILGTEDLPQLPLYLHECFSTKATDMHSIS